MMSTPYSQMVEKKRIYIVNPQCPLGIDSKPRRIPNSMDVEVPYKK